MCVHAYLRMYVCDYGHKGKQQQQKTESLNRICGMYENM